MNAILTIAEAADRLQVSRQRMHQLIESYHLQTQKIQGRLVVLEETELDKIAESRSNKHKAPDTLEGMSTATVDLSSLDELRKLVRDYQAETGHSLTELASRAGVSRTLVYRVVNGSYDSSPSYEFVCRLATAMGMKIQFQPSP